MFEVIKDSWSEEKFNCFMKNYKNPNLYSLSPDDQKELEEESFPEELTYFLHNTVNEIYQDASLGLRILITSIRFDMVIKETIADKEEFPLTHKDLLINFDTYQNLLKSYFLELDEMGFYKKYERKRPY